MFCCGSSLTHMSYQAVWKQPVRSFIFRRISVKLSLRVTFFNQSILLYKSDTTKSLLHSGLVTCSCQTRGEAVPLLEMSIYNALQSFKCWTFLFRKDLSCDFFFFFRLSIVWKLWKMSFSSFHRTRLLCFVHKTKIQRKAG